MPPRETPERREKRRERQRTSDQARYARARTAPGYLEKAAERARQWYRENRERVLTERRLSLYGVTEDHYAAMLAAQGGGCATCGRKDPGRKGYKAFMVDHCHQTGEVRGLLCNKCNTGVGLFQDNPELLLRAADYLLKHNLRNHG